MPLLDSRTTRESVVVTVAFIVVEEGDTTDMVMEMARTEGAVRDHGFEQFVVRFPWTTLAGYEYVTENTLRRLLFRPEIV